METGYVFLELKPKMKKDFMIKVKEIKAVKEARIVIGFCDAVVKIEAENIEELQKNYLNKIENIVGVVNSTLHIVACPRARK
jgi:DNA-binding Lrp family transcriptional regulator